MKAQTATIKRAITYKGPWMLHVSAAQCEGAERSLFFLSAFMGNSFSSRPCQTRDMRLDKPWSNTAWQGLCSYLLLCASQVKKDV